MRILVAEDHESLARTIALGLRREGMAVDVAHNGIDALRQAQDVTYDVVVLDRDLPGMHGDDVCRALVDEECPARLLMLTASSTIRDRVQGLGLGADDYLPKPFDFDELVARIRALARRSGAGLPPVLSYQDLTLDSGRRVARQGDRVLALSPKEFGVLEYLLSARGRAVSAEELLEHVWDAMADPFTATVKTTIARLRAKLDSPGMIVTVIQGGYRIGGEE